jgi:hypothetical protein
MHLPCAVIHYLYMCIHQRYNVLHTHVGEHQSVFCDNPSEEYTQWRIRAARYCCVHILYESSFRIVYVRTYVCMHVLYICEDDSCMHLAVIYWKVYPHMQATCLWVSFILRFLYHPSLECMHVHYIHNNFNKKQACFSCMSRRPSSYNWLSAEGTITHIYSTRSCYYMNYMVHSSMILYELYGPQ